MPALSEALVLEAIAAVRDPDLDRPFVASGGLRSVKVDGGRVLLSVRSTVPGSPHRAQLESDLKTALVPVPGVTEVKVDFAFEANRTPAAPGAQTMVPGVRNVVLVGSGKGGVGKSTVAVNLAVSLAKAGAKVGLLDADIYGPSIPIMLGVRGKKPTTVDGNRVQPIDAHGLKLMSIGFFVEADQALVWRGPMIQGALVQFFRDVDWGELDYLVIDLPPGTGDIQLTISQQVKVAGAVVVTTPQDLALADALKAKTMFDKVQIPILGFVENMSYFACPGCGLRTEIFHHGGGAAAAKKLDVPFLGEVPLVLSVREGGDAGVPVVVGAPESAEAKALRSVASKVAEGVARANAAAVVTRVGPAPASGKGLVQIKL